MEDRESTVRTDVALVEGLGTLKPGILDEELERYNSQLEERNTTTISRLRLAPSHISSKP
ncbi:hypothetical protein WG66_015857 [Moniliophthora roreri]|nr:hypothetical protein WG66_015857 [Moniliophthora roreri]